jgi:thioredoxin reductase (NADPH)
MSEQSELTTEQFDGIARYGSPREVSVGEVVFQPGDRVRDLILIESGWIEILSAPSGAGPGEVVAAFGPGGLLGELNLLTGQPDYLTARVTRAGRLHVLSPDRLRQLMTEDPDTSDVLLRSFVRDREEWHNDTAAGSGIEIVGQETSAAALALRTFVARHGIAHQWIDADTVVGQALLHSTPLGLSDLPAVLTSQEVIHHATPGKVAKAVGLHTLPAAEIPTASTNTEETPT